MRRIALFVATSALALVWSSECSAQILHKKKKVDKSTAASNTAEPDKLLYDKAMEDIKHGRHETGRLGLQTLINTYPDSEYLAKAKLAIADSYFKQGGTSNITQAIAGYKDFIVFFPFLPEAAYAQMQVAMANYNEMPKSDRDNTHALDAEAEFQTFLTKYPKDPLAPQAEQRLREVQESLAEGQYRIAYYYYLKGDRKAAAGRLIPLVRRYPLYSRSDNALWMLGDMFEKSERKDFAATYYSQILKNYPLSSKANAARDKLKAFGVPVPQPDAQAVAWMQKEQNTPRPKEALYHKPMGMFHSGPDVRMAAHNGAPQLQPDVEDEGVDILKGGGHATIATNQPGNSGGSGSGGTGVVSTVKPGEPAPAASEDTSASSTDTAANTSTTGASNANGTTTDAQGNSNSTATNADGTSSTSGNGSSNSTDSNSTDSTQNSSASSNQNPNGKESSSKKKGLKKILPW